MKNEDTLLKRYAFKLLTNSIGLVFGIALVAVSSRGLGAKAYGDFGFLTDFFSKVLAFLSMGTSLALFTKLSQRQKEQGILSFYFLFSCFVTVLLLLFVTSSVMMGWERLLWPEQQVSYVFWAAIFGLLTWFVQILTSIADAYGATVPSEKSKLLQKGIGFFLLIVFFFTGLNLDLWFFYHFGLLGILIYFLVRVIKRHGSLKFRDCFLSISQFKDYGKEFYEYSHPLFTFSLVWMIVGILDRWLLQHFGGSVEQGFYTLSYQVGMLCFLFTSAMTPLITREFAIAHGNNNIPELTRLFRRYIPLFYTISAYFACFLAVQSEKVIFIIGGKTFGDANWAVAIMAFYSVHQTYGQLSASVFHATGQTSLYRNIGVTRMIIGLPVTYFLVAPHHQFGLDAGAVGLAGKMVVMQIITVNVQLWFNTRLLHLNFIHFIAHQIVSVGCLLCISYVSIFIVDVGLGLDSSIWISFFVSGVLYTLFTAILCLSFPIVFGIYRADLDFFVSYCLDKVRFKKQLR